MRRSLLALILLALTGISAFAADPKTMTVMVQKTQIRASSSYLGTVVATLSYGDKVTILAQPAGAPKDWLYILAPGGKTKGWVNASALTAKKVELSSSSGVQQTASSGDVALAGKGFNSSVEAEYSAEKGLDFTWVDRMAGLVVSPGDLGDFVRQGGLSIAGGQE